MRPQPFLKNPSINLWVYDSTDDGLTNIHVSMNPQCTLGVFHNKKSTSAKRVLSVRAITDLGGGLTPSTQTFGSLLGTPSQPGMGEIGVTTMLKRYSNEIKLSSFI